VSVASHGFDRATVPLPGEIRQFDFPQVRSFDLDTGLSVRVARMPGLPVVSASLILEAGETGVPADRAGLAVLTGDALQAGTARRSGAELAEALERVGVGLAAATGWDATTVSLGCLSERLVDAVELMAEVVGEASFEKEEFTRIRQQRLATIRQRLMDPRRLADDAAAHFIFADGVAYSRSAGGTRASIGGVGREQAAEYAASHYRPAGAGLVVAGDVDPDAVARLAGPLLAHRGGEGVARPALVVEPRSRERAVHLLHRPGAVQSEIRIGHVGVARSSDDFFALSVLNTVLGGAFTSRLNLNLRERHGFTYGVRSSFGFRRHPGPFRVATAVATEVTADAVREAMSELDGIVRDGPTDAEVQAARDYIVGVFPLRLETTGQVASRIADLIVHRFPDDYYATYRDRVAAVTTADATDAGRRAIRPEEMAVVVVGDADALRRPLEALELGPVQVHDPEVLLG
jgi:zinc protease